MNTILVVEDGLTDREIINGYLKQAGYYVINAIDADETKEKLSQNKPDLIFLDVILPGKSGFEICRELKDNPTTSQIPIIFCSTKNSDVDKMWGTMLGADAYLAKPIQKEALMDVIKQLSH
ncbi:response regulator transcription factor [Calothrix sp. 336/3]|uniref:response regulator transcription factor n=1 Tax=Calothrix sp. 336/3 TaxID=1337936 RepID=UPI0004E42EF0|nr:response regulator [Calothrix sp. 336/3]AKG22653.1 chemotaxis protein CheY [Calothrix sp. 336/3]